MNIHDLRILYSVAQRTGITAAAAGLLLRQPAVARKGLSVVERA